jgi:hypothetical protein
MLVKAFKGVAALAACVHTSVPAESSAARQKTNIRLFILASLAVEDGDRLREKRSSFFYEVDRLEVLSVGVAFRLC